VCIVLSGSTFRRFPIPNYHHHHRLLWQQGSTPQDT